jgi:hypothetical protein
MGLKYTLRDLFWALVVCAVVAGWYVDHRRLTVENQRLKIAFQNALNEMQADAQFWWNETMTDWMEERK